MILKENTFDKLGVKRELILIKAHFFKRFKHTGTKIPPLSYLMKILEILF